MVGGLDCEPARAAPLLLRRLAVVEGAAWRAIEMWNSVSVCCTTVEDV